MEAPAVNDLINDGASIPAPTVNTDRLRSYFDRVTRLETERRELGDAIKDIYTEVKAAGFNPAALRKLVQRELETDKQRAKREQDQEDLDVMRAALGEFADSPLGRAAISAASATH